VNYMRAGAGLPESLLDLLSAFTSSSVYLRGYGDLMLLFYISLKYYTVIINKETFQKIGIVRVG